MTRREDLSLAIVGTAVFVGAILYTIANVDELWIRLVSCGLFAASILSAWYKVIWNPSGFWWKPVIYILIDRILTKTNKRIL